jgi:hypothetical protein
VPKAGDDVIVDGSGAYTVTLSSNTAALNSLLINNPGVTLAVGKFMLQVAGAGASALHLQAGQITINQGTIAADGLQIDSGEMLSGKGTVAAALTGGGTVKASGGTLDLTASVGTGLALRINTTAGSDLKIDGTATAANAIPINNTNQTLEIGASGSLAVGTKESITNGKIELDGGTLTDSIGISVGSGAHLTGWGAVTAGAAASDIDGIGNVTASGGTLELKTRVDATAASVFDILAHFFQ